jgi:hypothetical protein
MANNGQIFDAIKPNVAKLAKDYKVHVTDPLKPIALEMKCKWWNVAEDTVQLLFNQLLLKSQCWYNLLGPLGFEADDKLPCNLTVAPLSPDAVAVAKMIEDGTKLLADISSQVTKAEQEKLQEIAKEKERLNKRRLESLADAEKAKLQRESEQREANKYEMSKVEKSHERRLKIQEEEAEKAIAAAAAEQARVKVIEEMVMEIKSKQDKGELISAAQMTAIPACRIDPLIGQYAKKSTVISDMPAIAASQLLSQLSASQSSTTTTAVSNRPQPSRPKAIDLTHSDDEREDNVDLVLKSDLGQISWPKHGLSTDVVTPALWALKNIEPEDQKLFTQNAWKIFNLGIEALRNQEARLAESSGGSDSSKRSFTVGPGATSSPPKSKKKKRYQLDPAAFASSVLSSSISERAKGKRKEKTPVFSSDSEEQAGSGADE